MVSTAAFDHSKEMVRSMTRAQVLALQEELDKRHEYFASASRVFSVAELRERILEYVDFEDIFVLLRVNEDFFNIVKGSQKLRRKAFIEPSPTDDQPATEANLHPHIHLALRDAGFAIDEGTKGFSAQDGVQELELWCLISWNAIEQHAPRNPSSYAACSQYHMRRFEGPKEVSGSWAITLVTDVPLRVRLCFVVEEALRYGTKDKFSLYCDVDGDKTTLGDLRRLSIAALERLAYLGHHFGRM